MRTKDSVGLAIIEALAAALVIKLLAFDFMIIDGPSMTPALRDGEVIAVNRLAYGLRVPLSRAYLLRWASPKPGEVVVFYTPLGDLAIKRCALVLEGQPPARTSRFVALGDNTAASFDSRSYGPVPLDNIVGKAFQPARALEKARRLLTPCLRARIPRYAGR